MSKRLWSNSVAAAPVQRLAKAAIPPPVTLLSRWLNLFKINQGSRAIIGYEANRSITLEEALEAHLSEKPHRQRTVEGYRYHLSRYLGHFREFPISDISRQMVRDHYIFLKQNHGETTAASTMRTLKAVINTAMRLDETLNSNPVGALYIPGPKRRKVPPIDLQQWWTNVSGIPPVRRDLHIAMLLTGARRSSILQVKRKDVDLDRALLTFTHMKTSDEPLTFPMGEFLTKLIADRLLADIDRDSPWLWPSPMSRLGRITEPKVPGLPTPHEYRHYARTFYIAAGVPYAQGALLLGQRLPGATGAYVHLEHLVEDLRADVQALENYILARIR
ncbi:MAG: phage integrase SAM-like domain-containing protein [Candidatus Andeanibacterium colombiense]|uniref:Phage integrase SAM-like domain-containing protein n=1 Tax=Candidatus Andeanibacterium colombiense TaxID=3121345 RepID=A0AAJ6BLZ4_9SPHN|nr:MAG: phage integrase SAM-like domain-containing protein [Sphingomonadaceae bacterium]